MPAIIFITTRKREVIVDEPDRAGDLPHDESPFRHIGGHLNRHEPMGAEEIQCDRRKLNSKERGRRSVTKEIVVLRGRQHLESVFRPQAAMSASTTLQSLKR